MGNDAVLNTLVDMVTPICRDNEEISAIPLYIRTDKYRKKMIDFLFIAEDKGDTITADQLILLMIKLSNEEVDEYGKR